ncbi:hypothetical protein DCAR_0519818 [Daucus carota subsp. sativus]|uniref:Uncharacterized protein n=1 Tax=Daucus carota subsp. sativus TaxID=79200 RepID=A0A161YKU9_DAUCS|nr:hypothetical protein DCAR_0519818 [Daucus carota subsp. sativus]
MKIKLKKAGWKSPPIKKCARRPVLDYHNGGANSENIEDEGANTRNGTEGANTQTVDNKGANNDNVGNDNDRDDANVEDEVLGYNSKETEHHD